MLAQTPLGEWPRRAAFHKAESPENSRAHKIPTSKAAPLRPGTGPLREPKGHGRCHGLALEESASAEGKSTLHSQP